MRRVIDGVAACLALAAASLAAPAQTPPAPAPQPPAQLTLAQAERIAIQNNPNIGIARLLTLAQGQVAREARSASMPTLVGNMTAVGAHDNTASPPACSTTRRCMIAPPADSPSAS
jgi:outer membrane protein TolC